MLLGDKIRNTRETKSLLLRQVAAFLEIDTAYLSKVERGERNLKKEQVTILEEYFGFKEEELVNLWLCDKINETIYGHKNAIHCLKMVINQLEKK